MANKKFSEFVLKTSTSDVSHIVGYNGAAENVQITPANFVTGGGTGIFLPLAGGTMTGALVVDSTATVNDILTAGLGLAVTGGTVGSGKLVLASTNKVHLSGGSAGLVLQNTGGTKSLTIDDTLSTFVGLVSGITPVDASNFVTKAYVDGGGGAGNGFLPLTGGTLTGNLIGTTATFTGIVSLDGTNQIYFVPQAGESNNEAMRILRSSDTMFFTYGVNANEEAFSYNSSGNTTFANDVTVKGSFLNIFGGNSALAGSIQAYTSQGGLYLQASGPNQNIGLIPSGTGKVRVTGASADTTLSIETETGTTIFPILDFISSHSTVGGQIRQGGTSVIAFDKALNSTFGGDVSVGNGKFLRFPTAGGTGGNATINYTSSAFTLTSNNSTAPMIFETSSTEKMRLDSDGRLGLGVQNAGAYTSVAANNFVFGSSSNSGMTILSGTTTFGNIAFADGIATNDQYRGLIQYGHTLNSMQFFTNAAERMRLDSAGSLKINTTLSSQGKLTVKSNAGAATFYNNIQCMPSERTTGGLFLGSNVEDDAIITTGSYYFNAGTHTATGGASSTILLSGGNTIFKNNTGLTSGNVFTPTERMRISSGGDLMVGTTSSFALATHDPNVITSQSFGVSNGTNNSTFGLDRIHFDSANYFVLNQGAIGVKLVNNATAWAAQSDESLKENIKPLENVLDKIKDYRCVEYNLKAEKTDKKIGFIAQDWEQDFAPIVDKDSDGILSMKYTETIPVLLKAIQELKAEIELLKNK